MGSKQREAHPNNTISRKRDRSSADSERASEMRCLCSVLKVERPLLGWTGFLSCQPGLWPWFTFMTMSLASSFSSPFLFTLSQVMFLTSFQLPNLTSLLLKPNMYSWHPYLRFQRLSHLCSDFGHKSIYWLLQSFLQKMDLGLFQEQCRPQCLPSEKTVSLLLHNHVLSHKWYSQNLPVL